MNCYFESLGRSPIPCEKDEAPICLLKLTSRDYEVYMLFKKNSLTYCHLHELEATRDKCISKDKMTLSILHKLFWHFGTALIMLMITLKYPIYESFRFFSITGKISCVCLIF